MGQINWESSVRVVNFVPRGDVVGNMTIPNIYTLEEIYQVFRDRFIEEVKEAYSTTIKILEEMKEENNG